MLHTPEYIVYIRVLQQILVLLYKELCRKNNNKIKYPLEKRSKVNIHAIPFHTHPKKIDYAKTFQTSCGSGWSLPNLAEVLRNLESSTFTELTTFQLSCFWRAWKSSLCHPHSKICQKMIYEDLKRDVDGKWFFLAEF